MGKLSIVAVTISVGLTGLSILGIFGLLPEQIAGVGSDIAVRLTEVFAGLMLGYLIRVDFWQAFLCLELLPLSTRIFLQSPMIDQKYNLWPITTVFEIVFSLSVLGAMAVAYWLGKQTR